MTGVDYLDGLGGTIDASIRHQAIASSQELAIEFEDLQVTYSELDALIDGVARSLAAAGIRQGDAVAVQMHNRLEFVYLMLGIMRAGAIYVPCSTHYTPDELAHQLSHVDARCIFVDAAGASHCRGRAVRSARLWSALCSSKTRRSAELLRSTSSWRVSDP